MTKKENVIMKVVCSEWMAICLLAAVDYVTGSFWLGVLAWPVVMFMTLIFMGAGKDTEAEQIKKMDVNSDEYLIRYMPKP